MVFTALVAWVLFGGKGKSVEDVTITVIDKPTQALLPIRAEPHEKPKETKKPRAVFGLSRKSIQSEDSTIAVKAGNTVAKAPDNEKLKDSDVDSLPVPTEEYLVTQMPRLLTEFRVPYPPEAKQKKIQGTVVMSILIDQNGNAREATLISGPGTGLNEAAEFAVIKHMKFRPAYVDDKPVAVRMRFSYRFILEN